MALDAVTYLVLLKPRPDLSAAEREQLIAAFERALTEIPAVRQVQRGRRITTVRAMKPGCPTPPIISWRSSLKTSRGSRRTLRHPAHEELGVRFTESLAGALVYDFEGVGLESLRHLPG